MKWSFFALLLGVAILLFQKIEISSALIDTVCRSFSTERIVISCESGAFGIFDGLQLRGLKVFDRERKRNWEPIVSAQNITVWPLSRLVRVTELRFPSLQDSYYGESLPEKPIDRPPGEQSAEPFTFPDVPPFTLELIRSDILGIQSERVTASVNVLPERLSFDDILLAWPDRDVSMQLTGNCTVDLAAKRVWGGVQGLARQPNIRPLLGDYTRKVTLDVPVALPYFDAFTHVVKPVPASCTWDVNLDTYEFTIKIGLKPELGRYNNVPLKSAEGGITVHVYWPENRMDYDTTVEIVDSRDHQNRPFGGKLTVFGTNDVRTVCLRMESGLEKQNMLDIIGYLNQGVFDEITCKTPPHVTLDGVLATHVEEQRYNNLKGTVDIAECLVHNVAITNLTSRFHYLGDTIHLTQFRGVGRTGGVYSGTASLKVPLCEFTNGTYAVDLDYRNGSVAELSDIFHFDLGKRHGKAEGHLTISGTTFGDVKKALNGKGNIVIRDGHLAQMKLFMGLTEILAKSVPGISSIVNQSKATASFTVTDGILASKDVLIEGALFSITAEGQYDTVQDDLDFKVRVRLMKDDAVPGLREFVRLLSWPFSKLLMEFRVRGHLDNPTWEYVSLLDRVK